MERAPVSARTRELIRAAAELALRSADVWIAEVDAATLSTPLTSLIAADPAAADAVRRGNYDNLVAWASANLRAPGEPVPANTSDVQLDVARDLVRSGMFEIALDTYRTGQNAAWQRWMQLCFTLTDDAAELREVLSVTSASIGRFIDVTIEAVAGRIGAERTALTQGSAAERRDLVTLLLQGSPVAPERAEMLLGHRLGGDHTAAVLWAAPQADLGVLERGAEALMRAAGARRRLTVQAGVTTLWVWLPVAVAPDPASIRTALGEGSGARLALGTPGHGVEGFRRSHRDAVEARRFADRVGALDEVITFDDVQLAALVGDDSVRAGDFTERVLGDLVRAPAELRATALTYLQHLGNASATAEALFTHRNTVLRRVRRVDELLPRPLASDPVRIGVALQVLRWRGSGA